MIEVPLWSEVSRIAVVNTMVAGGEIIGFTLMCLGFWPLIKFLIDERNDIRQEKKDLLEAIKALKK